MLNKDHYVIREKEGESNLLYWSNDMGWVAPSGATVFTAQDKMDLNLPMNGEWIKVTITIPKNT